MYKKKIRIAISGAGGRMGKQLIKDALKMNEIVLSSAIEYKDSSLLGHDAGELVGKGKIGVTIQSIPDMINNDFDVFIDFTCPEGTMNYLNFCRQYGKSMVIGTTGFNEEEKKTIREVSNDIPIVFSANFSIGMNIMLQLLKEVAKTIGSYTDIEIVEKHHRYKVDVPSGTALEMGKVISDALHKDLKECAVYNKGYTGKRIVGTIGFSTIRAGNIFGEHKAMFIDVDEQIEIIHKASSRSIYAKGALRSAVWIKHRKNGLFDVKDVLELNELGSINA